MNQAEFLNGLFTKIGVDVENPALKEIVTKVAAMDISDELVAKFNSSYMTEAAAKANTKIIGHFRAQHYNGLDDEIKPLYDELEIPEEVKAELFKETSSTKRVATLIRKVKELESKKVGTSKGDKLELENQIKALNGQIKTEKETAQAEIAKAKNDFDDKLKDVYLTQNLSGITYASDSYKDEDFLLPKTKINQALKAKNLKVVLDGKEFKLQTEQGVAHFENNQEVTFKSFTDKILADNKYTAVSDPAKQNQPQKTIVVENGKKGFDTSKFDQKFAEMHGTV
jgi:ribosomal protein L12E/L44/L45/RPP1/RPP2/uncharacterized protein YehS (DUF1456 family)